MKNPPTVLTGSNAKILGIFWFVAAIVFVVAAVGLIRKESWWTPVTLVACLLSIALTAAFLPYAKIGLLVDLALVAFLFVNRGTGWITTTA
jgi:hypothetical protein